MQGKSVLISDRNANMLNGAFYIANESFSRRNKTPEPSPSPGQQNHKVYKICVLKHYKEGKTKGKAKHKLMTQR